MPEARPDKNHVRRQSPILILDDPFVNLDDGNFRRAVKLLKTAAPSCQIIYLSCTAARNGSDDIINANRVLIKDKSPIFVCFAIFRAIVS